MNMEHDSLVSFRDGLRSMADTVDELIALDAKEKAGEDVSDKGEAVLGKFMVQAIKLNSLKDTVL